MSKRIEVKVERNGFDGRTHGEYCYWSHKVNGAHARLIVKGAKAWQGYGISGWTSADFNRTVTGGPLVKGPHAEASECCTVIDNHGGTPAQIERDRVAGLVVECEPGDILIIEGDEYMVSLGDQRGHRGAQVVLTAIAQ